MSTTQQVSQFKTKAKATWSSGSYNEIARSIAPVASHLVKMANVREGDEVLDVATGTGVTAITARLAGADVTGIDLTPELLQHAREEARTAGVDGITWREGDAEDLPFPDASFDVVLSSFGHMFAPRPDVTAREMMRMVRPGGRIAFVTHVKGNVAQAMLGVVAKHVPPPNGAPPSPFEWGDRDVVRERLGDGARDIAFEEGDLVYHALSVGHFWEFFSTKYGPVVKAIQALGSDAGKVADFRRDFMDAVEPFWSDGAVRFRYMVTRATL